MDNKDVQDFMQEHDRRALAIQEMIAPIYDKIDKIEAKADTKIEAYFGTISSKLNSLLTNITEIKIDQASIKSDIGHIKECQKKNSDSIEVHEEELNTAKGGLAFLKVILLSLIFPIGVLVAKEFLYK